MEEMSKIDEQYPLKPDFRRMRMELWDPSPRDVYYELAQEVIGLHLTFDYCKLEGVKFDSDLLRAYLGIDQNQLSKLCSHYSSEFKEKGIPLEAFL